MTMTMTNDLVQTQIADGIATLHLNRAEKRNALDRALMEALGAALAAIRDDAAVRVVVLRGRGPVFSSGIDHTFLVDIMQKAQHVPFAHLHHDLQDIFHGLERMQKPVIVALHRAAVGMAFELALACDFRIATADCMVGLPEIAFGIIPDVGGTTRLVRAAGVVVAKELILTGKLIDAARAAQLGLITEVASDEADLDRRVAALAALLAGHAPAGVGAAKTLIQQSAEVDERTSFQLEGTVQQILLKQPDLAERFPRALAFIKAQLAR